MNINQNYILEDIEGEVWLPVKGYEGVFSISNFGRVKSLPKNLKLPTGKYFLSKEKIMHLHIDKRYGYCQLDMQINGKHKTQKPHRMVAIAFIPNPNNYNQVNHKDGNKTNNHVSNLEWCNNSLNQKHAYSTGLNIAKKGENHHNSKITDLQLNEILIKSKSGKSAYSIAKEYSVVPMTIHRIIKGIRKESWA